MLAHPFNSSTRETGGKIPCEVNTGSCLHYELQANTKLPCLRFLKQINNNNKNKTWALVFQDKASLYSSGCPAAHFVDQGGLELRDPPVSAFQVLGLKTWATTAWLKKVLKKSSQASQGRREWKSRPFLVYHIEVSLRSNLGLPE